jgi:hypothetical protein
MNTLMHEGEDLSLPRDRIRHVEAVNELDDCICSIPQLTEHRRFLLGPTPEDEF